MSQSAKGGGIGLCGALFIAFVVLRLTDHIDWEWYWVASPLWLPLAAGLGIVAVALVLYLPIAAVSDWRNKRERARRAAARRGEWS